MKIHLIINCILYCAFLGIKLNMTQYNETKKKKKNKIIKERYSQNILRIYFSQNFPIIIFYCKKYYTLFKFGTIPNICNYILH
jgi:hypothetical protein